MHVYLHSDTGAIENTLSDFRVEFHPPLHLSTPPGTSWEMGLCEVSMPNSIYALHEDDPDSVAIIQTTSSSHLAPTDDMVYEEMELLSDNPIQHHEKAGPTALSWHQQYITSLQELSQSWMSAEHKQDTGSSELRAKLDSLLKQTASIGEYIRNLLAEPKKEHGTKDSSSPSSATKSFFKDALAAENNLLYMFVSRAILDQTKKLEDLKAIITPLSQSTTR